MGLVDGNHMIQQFAAAVADPPLGDAVLPRTADRLRTVVMFIERIAPGTSVPYLAS